MTRVALTFDVEHPDHPHPPEGVNAVLDVLARRGVRATFFLQGRWVRSEPGAARRIVRAGHEIGNHSHHHAPLDGLRRAARRRDVADAQRAIREVTGADPRPWFRCPFGDGMDEPGVLADLAALGYVHVGWDVDPWDWHPDTAPGDVRDRVLAGVRDRAGQDSIVLLHGWPAATHRALDELVGALVADDVRLVGMAQLTRRS